MRLRTISSSKVRRRPVNGLEINWDDIKKGDTPFKEIFHWHHIEMMYKLKKIEGQDIKLDGIFKKQKKDQRGRQHLNSEKFKLIRTDLLAKTNKEQYFDYK